MTTTYKEIDTKLDKIIEDGSRVFPQRDDANWLRSTLGLFTPEGPRFEFESIDTSILKPVARKYD